MEGEHIKAAHKNEEGHLSSRRRGKEGGVAAWGRGISSPPCALRSVPVKTYLSEEEGGGGGGRGRGSHSPEPINNSLDMVGLFSYIKEGGGGGRLLGGGGGHMGNLMWGGGGAGPHESLRRWQMVWR